MRDGKGKGWRDALWFLLLVASVAVLWYLSWIWVDQNIKAQFPWSLAPELVKGAFGDQFGAINSLFSGLAFAGVIFTVLLQKRELSLQREQFEEQNETLARQRFESTFFKLIELHHEITGGLRATGGDGRKALDAFFIYFVNAEPEFPAFRSLRKLNRDQIRQIQDERTVDDATYPALSPADVTTISEALRDRPRVFESFLDDDLAMHEAKVRLAYQKACLSYLDDVAHYFRNLYQALRIIEDNNSLSDEEKTGYARILRSQLSDIELVSLFYNALTKYEIPGRTMELGFPKMGRLLKKFDILQNMNEGDLIHPKHRIIFDLNYRGGNA